MVGVYMHCALEDGETRRRSPVPPQLLIFSLSLSIYISISFSFRGCVFAGTSTVSFPHLFLA